MSIYAGTETASPVGGKRQVDAGLKRLALAYVWITIACSGIVFAEPAPADALMVGAIVLLPLVGLTRFTRGIGLYMALWALIVVASFLGATQASVFDVPTKYTGITLYLALSSVVMAAFVLKSPVVHVRLIMTAYLVAALIAACTGLIGYFNILPGAADLFTLDFARARGTFKDPNVLGAFLVPPLLYVLNLVVGKGVVRGSPWLLAAPILLFGSLLAFSRGAWINLAVSLLAYACFTFTTVSTHRQRLQLIVYVMFVGILTLGTLATALSVPHVADVMEERARLDQPYDVGPEGRFGGQKKAVGLVVTHPLGIGALEFARSYNKEDVHEVYLNMFLNAGWIGGTLYLALVMLTLWIGLRQVVRDRGGDGMSAVLLAAFIGMAFEGVVIDTDHWRHFYLIMAMIWGMALAPATIQPWQRRRDLGVGFE